MGIHNRSKWTKVFAVIIPSIVMVWIVSEAWTAEGKYPNRPIRVVIGYTPGSTDMAFRPFADKLPEYIGQPITFVYKPGATGAVGASFVAKAKPDGYTLIGAPAASVLTPPLTQEGLDYTVDDFVPICRLVKSPIMLVVKTDAPWKTVKDVVEEAKKFPGKLAYSSAGVFSSANLSMEWFLKSAGINMTHVPCEGSTPAVTALLGSHVNMTSSAMASPMPHIKAGTIRPIGVFEKNRLKEFPGVPTFLESGYPVVLYTWYGFMVPKGTPEEVIKTIYMACKKVVEEHRDFIEDRLGKMSFKLDFLSPEEFASEVKAENEIMKNIIKDLMKPK
jgi:tripartite-type tricarboxylate transporter receptor subunit TctC